MNTDDISGFLENMTRESEKQIELIRLEGQERIHQFKEETGRELAAYIESLAREDELFAKETVSMERNRWRLEFQRLKLREYESFLEVMIDQAIKHFREQERDSYRQWMAELFREILDDAGAGPLEIILNQDDRDMEGMLKQVYLQRGGQPDTISIKNSSVGLRGGMKVLCLDRPLAYHATVERILARSMDDMRLAVRDCLDKAGKNPEAAGGGTGGN